MGVPVIVLSERARYATLTAGIVALIAYGSLFPFQFHACVGGPAALLRTPATPAERGDALSNILLYVPLGFFGYRALRGSRMAFAAAALGGTALSFLIESAQFCDLGRVPSMADVWTNAAGTMLGALASAIVGGNVPFAALLAACWLGTRTLPYLPSVEFAKYRAALGPLIHGRIDPLALFHSFALWLAAAAVVDMLVGVKRARWAISALAAVIFAARIVVVDLTLEPSEMLGALAAIAAWNAIAGQAWRMKAIGALFAAYIVESALEPFRFLTAPRPFGWIPFYSFMVGPRENGSRVFLEKCFSYGFLVSIAVASGLRWRVAAFGAVALVLASRVVQIYLPGRSAEITDALMVAMMAATMWILKPRA
jgi:VanZ family protein